MARTLATLLGGGIPLVNSLEIAARSTGNRHMGRELDIVAQRVREGQSFAGTLLERQTVPDVAIKMIEVGESTGALTEMLNSLADFYDEEIETEVARFVTVIEPAMLVIMGLVIAVDRAGAVPAAVRDDFGDWKRVMEPRPHDDTLDPEALIEDAAVRSVSAEERSAEEAAARRLADRYRLEFLDMHEFRIDQELFRSIPADLMLRYGFVPYRRDGRSLVIVVSDPTDLPMIDELSGSSARRSG